MGLLPIMRPKLPAAEKVLPYLQGIDASRIYSNLGPLVAQLEARLGSHYGVSGVNVSTVSNGTAGLTLALMAQHPRPGSLCIIPAWTFIASAQAAVLAGLRPYFVDVDPSSWALQPSAALKAIQEAPDTVGGVMPVVPFGRPIDFAAWDAFRSRTGLPVVIDAAAGFDSLQPSAVPAVVSLHATKVIGIGEGGFVLSTDDRLIADVRTRSNFGFHGTREAAVAAFNAKLSEYQASVGHAALDEWEEARADWLKAGSAYRRLLRPAENVLVQEGFGDKWVSSVCVLEVVSGDASEIENKLNRADIETRRWWGSGAHAHRSMAGMPRTALTITERLARATVALPLHRDLALEDIERVCDRILAAS